MPYSRKPSNDGVLRGQTVGGIVDQPALNSSLSSADKEAQECGRLLMELRQYMQLSRPDLAARLGTRVEDIEAIETGDVVGFPPWTETSRIVTALTTTVGIDPQPVLRLLAQRCQDSQVRASQAPRPNLRPLPVANSLFTRDQSRPPVSPLVPAFPSSLRRATTEPLIPKDFTALLQQARALERPVPPTTDTSQSPDRFTMRTGADDGRNVPGAEHGLRSAPPPGRGAPPQIYRASRATGDAPRSHMSRADVSRRDTDVPSGWRVRLAEFALRASSRDALPARSFAPSRTNPWRVGVIATACVLILVIVGLRALNVGEGALGNASVWASTPDGAPIQSMMQRFNDFIAVQFPAEKDGLPWINVSDPRTRRADKLRVKTR